MLKLRYMVASLLTVLLLCGSAWASACDLSCQLQTKAACASGSMEQGSDHAAMAMDCDHCGHAHVAMQMASAGCPPMMCDHASLQTARSVETAHALLEAPQQVAVGPVVLAAPHGYLRDGHEVYPPPYASTFHPLLVSLRV
jgi:hypothetical protein